MVCTKLPDPARLCEAKDLWVETWSRDNSEAQPPSVIRIDKSVGVTSTKSDNEGGRMTFVEAMSMSMSLKTSYAGLSGNFGMNLGTSVTTGISWTTMTQTQWVEETTTYIDLTVPAGCIVTLYQAVGKCAGFTVKTNRVKRVDEGNCTVAPDP